MKDFSKISSLSFSQSLKHSLSFGSRHILIGNGFSIALKDIFSYRSLYEKADFRKLPVDVRKIFEKYETEDFEKVMNLISHAKEVIGCLGYKKEAEQLDSYHHRVRDALVSTLAKIHPPFPNAIAENTENVDQKYQACGEFLKSFDKLYTTNYDLILYWAIMRGGIKCDDGFNRKNPQGKLYWNKEQLAKQKLYYLHGALHLFNDGLHVEKKAFAKEKTPIHKQITQALKKSQFPLFVSEGKSQDKLMKIKRVPYLSSCLESLGQLEGALFTYGFSFSPGDFHILDTIMHSKIRALYIGVRGTLKQKKYRELKAYIAQAASNARNKRLEIYSYDIQSTNVWGKQMSEESIDITRERT